MDALRRSLMKSDMTPVRNICDTLNKYWFFKGSITVPVDRTGRVV
jgi:hypothetical protein